MQTTPTDLAPRPASARRVLRWAGTEALARALAATALLLVAACGGGSESTASAPPAAEVAEFSVEVTPASAIVFPGSGRLLTVTLTRAAGFTADVTVALGNAPAGVTAEARVFSGSVASLRLPVNLDGAVAPGNLALVFSASSGTRSASVTAQLSVQAAQPRATEKIAAALAAGDIDVDTSLLYRLYALVGDPRLPEAYVGSGSSREDVGLFAQVEDGLPQMSVAMQAAMHPFLVRPDHPDSIYRRPGTSARSTKLSTGPGRRETAAALSPSECVAGAQWASVRSATIPVRVWTECDDIFVLTAPEPTLQVLEKIWRPMTQLMGLPRLDGDRILDSNGNDITDNGGDDAIDVYMVQSYSISREGQPNNTAELGSALAYARAASPCLRNSAGNSQCSGYIVLPAAAAGTQLQRSAIIHEFFHVLQNRHNASLSGKDWFKEASAQWAETHYDREIEWPAKVAMQSVHLDWLDKYVQSNDPLDELGKKHPYSAYLWPFFLEQETGGPLIVGQIWTALETAKTVADENRVIDSLYGFDANFHKFALRNVNEELLPGDPVRRRYVELPGVGQFPECLATYPECKYKPKYLISTLASGTEDTRAYRMKPLSARYAQFLVNGEALPNRVEFDFSALSNRGSLKLDALVRTTTTAGHEWVSEPVVLNPDSKAVFCFDLGKSTTTVRGEFNELRLVLSNSSKDTEVAGDVIVRPTKKPCGVWEGTVDTTIDFEFAGATTRMTSSATLAFEFDEALSDNFTRAYTVRSGNFSFQSRTDIPNRNPACRSIATGSGTVRPQNTPMDLSDGAASGAVATFTSDAGTPKYRTGGVLVFTTLTVVDNCNDRNVDVTSQAPMSTVVLWVPQEGQTFDIKQDGTAMQESRSFQLGPETRTSTWNLSKKTE